MAREPRHGTDGLKHDEARDSVALRALYTHEAPRLSRFFRQRAPASDDPADLVQETFLRLLRGLPAGSIERPAAYLHRIARNLLFDRLRSRARSGAAGEHVSVDMVELSVPPEQADLLEASDLMKNYQRAVDALPPRTRQVFLLHRVDELGYKEIASRLGIGVRTVEWHMSEALVRIRRQLDEA